MKPWPAVLALLLGALAPAAAVTLKLAPAPGKGATLTGWSGAVAPALATLKGWDFGGEANRSKLLPLTNALEGLAGPASTPEGFSALTPAEKETVLNAAIETARQTASAKAAEIVAQIHSGVETSGSAFALRGAESFLASHGPYLSGTALKELEEALPILRAAAAHERDSRVGKRLEGVRRALETNRADEAPAPEVEVLPAGTPLPSAYDERFSLARAQSDQGPLTRVRERHGFTIRSLAARGKRDAFWVHVDKTFYDLELEFKKDDLELIEQHDLGSWAYARLASYDRQAAALWELVEQSAKKAGIGPRPVRVVAYGREIPPLETRRADDEAYTGLIEKLAAVRDRDARRLIARRRPALKAAAKLRSLRSIDFRAARPLVELARYHERNLAEGEANPDPAVLIQARSYGRDPSIPSPAKLLQMWETARTPRTLSTLRDNQWVLTFLASLSAVVGVAFQYYGSWTGAAAGYAALVVFGALVDRARGLRRRFEGLGARLDSLLRR